jgi:hypothetical protein
VGHLFLLFLFKEKQADDDLGEELGLNFVPYRRKKNTCRKGAAEAAPLIAVRILTF